VLLVCHGQCIRLAHYRLHVLVLLFNGQALGRMPSHTSLATPVAAYSAACT
jgi:hypothetical protein